MVKVTRSIKAETGSASYLLNGKACEGGFFLARGQEHTVSAIPDGHTTCLLSHIVW